MMNGHSFTPGQRIEWQHTSYEIIRLLDGDLVNLVALTTGEVITVKEQVLVNGLFTGTLHFAVEDPSTAGDDTIVTKRSFMALDECTPPQRLVTRYRYWVIEPLVMTGGQTRTQQAVEDRVATVQNLLARNEVPVSLTYDEEGPIQIPTSLSVRGVYRWLQAYETSGCDIRSLVPNWHKRGRQKYLSPAVDQIVTETIDKLYLKRERHTTDDVHLEVLLRVDEANAAHQEGDRLQAPSRSTIHRRIEKVDAADKLLAHRGKRTAKRLLTQYDQMEQPTRPLVRVEIDHTPVDVILIDVEDGLPLGLVSQTT